MSKFQIIIDCDTDDGAFFFLDALSFTCDILRGVTTAAELSIKESLDNCKERIVVRGSRMKSDNTYCEYTS